MDAVLASLLSKYTPAQIAEIVKKHERQNSEDYKRQMARKREYQRAYMREYRKRKQKEKEANDE